MPPEEVGDEFSIFGWSPLSYDDDTIELLALCFVESHDLKTCGGFHSIKELILSQGVIQSRTCLRISAVS